MATILVRLLDAGTGRPVDSGEVAVIAWPDTQTLADTELHWLRQVEPGIFQLDLPVDAAPVWRVCPVGRAPGYRENRDWLDEWCRRSRPRPEFPRVSAGEGAEITLRLQPGVTLEGRVTDEQGQPVENALLSLTEAGPTYCGWPHRFRFGDVTWPPDVVTDADGRFTWLSFPADRADVAEGARWVLSVEHADHAPAMVQQPDRHEGVVSLDIEMSDGRRISGTVLDADGAPAAGARVTATQAPTPDQPSCNRFVKDATTDADGRFTLHGLAPFVHELEASLPGRAPVTQTVDLDRDADEPTLRLGAGCDLVGRVVDARGEPLSRVGYFAYLDGEGSIRRSGETGPDGEFRVTGLPSGATMVLRVFGLAERRIALPSEPVTVRVPDKVPVVLQLVGADGRPPADGAVYVYTPGASSFRVDLAPDGRSGPVELLPGVNQVVGLAPDLAAQALDLDVPETGLAEPVVLRLARGETISGRVVDAADRPVEGVRVSALPRSGQPLLRFYRQRDTTTGPDGRYTLSGLEGDYRIVFAHPAHALTGVHVKATAGVVDVRLTPGATLRGRVRDAGGRPRAGLLVQAAPMDEHAARFAAPFTLTDAEGGFVLERVPPGEIVLTVGSTTKELVAREGVERELELTVP